MPHVGDGVGLWGANQNLYIMINTVEEFLADIDCKVTFTSSDKINKEIFGDWKGRTVRLSYSVEVNSMGLDARPPLEKFPLQVIVRLDVELPNARGQKPKWQNLSRWGCESNEQNAWAIQWFLITDVALFQSSMRNGDDMGTALSKEWNG